MNNIEDIKKIKETYLQEREPINSITRSSSGMKAARATEDEQHYDYFS